MLKINEANIELFWRFVTERQNIWYKRNILKQDPPWTDDKILQTYKFTNIYRKLDPGTQYVINNILGKGTPEEVFFNIFIYRIFNRIETARAIGFIKKDEYNKKEIFNRIDSLRQQGKPVFTSAFMITGVKFAGSSDKVVNYLHVIDKIYILIFINKILNYANYNTFQMFHENIKKQQGIGEFLAYQIMLDAMYGQLLPYKEDEWTVAGNGARRGLNYIFTNLTKQQELEAMKHLHVCQQKYFEKYGLDFKYYNGEKISLSNIENCCCEFSKYKKVLDGTGRPRLKYKYDI